MGSVVLLALLVVGGVALGGQVLSGDKDPGATERITGFRPTEAGLTVTVRRGACDRVTGSSVRESAEEVVVTVRVEKSDRTCVGTTAQEQVPVTLEEPAADRAVYDGQCLAGEAEKSTCRVENKTLGGPKRT